MSFALLLRSQVSRVQSRHLVPNPQALRLRSRVSSHRVQSITPLSYGWKQLRSYSTQTTGLTRILNGAKEKLQKYGTCGTFVFFGISVLDFACFYALLSAGVDVGPIVEFFGFSPGASDKGVTIAMAYAAHKLFMPIRILLTLYITPLVLPYWHKYVQNPIQEKRKRKDDDDDD